jgi:acyl-CoA synthetase (AMP-forming)/AMP-acid ligase II
MGNRLEFVIVVLAAARLGMIVIPMNIRHRRPEILHMLTNSGAAALIYDGALTPEIPTRADLPHLRGEFVVGPSRRDGAQSFDDLLATITKTAPRPSIDEEAPFCILYTSGTTGKPKGAILTHLGVIHSVLHFQYGLGLEKGDVTALAVPASHVTGLVAILLPALHLHGTTVMMEAFKARDYLTLVERERITYTLMVPAMYNLCLLEPGLAGFDLGSWRVGGFGGAPMPTATITRLAEAIPKLKLSNVYGATETTSPATLLPPADLISKLDSVGRALPCAEIKVMDPDGRPVARGEKGEVWIAGAMTIPGYWDNPEANKAAFVDGYWRSGDIGSLDADGYLRIHDRLKDVINRGGYKIYCVEVESVLAEHQDVIESAVVGYADNVLGERSHAFVRLTECAAATPETLKAFCAARVADYKVPDRITFLADPLPRNANGKVLKTALRSRGA